MSKVTAHAQVDSRAYAFAYALRKISDFPADFPVTGADFGFVIGVFLPREQTGMFGTPRYPPRILVLTEHHVIIATHPALGRDDVCVPLEKIAVIESGRFLLDGWLTIVTRDARHCFRYNARDSKPVDEFLLKLRELLLPARTGVASDRAVPFGSRLDLKFRNAKAAELDCGECILASFFSPAMRLTTQRWLFRRESWTAADYVAITDRRLLWITDRYDGHRQEFGTMNSYTSRSRLSGGRCTCSDMGCELAFRITEGIAWRVPVPLGSREQAEKFLDEVRQICLPSEQQSSQQTAEAQRRGITNR